MIEVSVAVTELARFCHRSGDIDHRFTPSPTGIQGIAGHQRLYARRPASYEPEHAVEHQHTEKGLTLTLRGRADGYDAERAMVEEIKTCRVPPNSIPESVTRLHLAQGRLYAAIIAARDNLEQLEVRLTWLNIDSDEEYVLEQSYSAAELAQFLGSTLTQFTHWLHRVAQLKQQRDDSLATLEFPHGDFRPGQRDIAELSYKCIDQGGQLLLEAPTGIGKTAAVLFPALKALATGKHDKVVFATAKTIGRRAAQDTLAQFSDAGYRGSALTLTAKERICLSPGKACHGDDCPYARNYYDKLPQALEAAADQPSLAREDIEALAQQFEVCPYELAMDLLPWVDVIIADVHYLYSLSPLLGNAMAADSQRWSVLLDEAHNLPERARTMYSAKLAKAQLMKVKRDTKGTLSASVNRINRQFLAVQKVDWAEPEFHSSPDLPTTLIQALQDFVGAVSEQMAAVPAFLQQNPLLMDFYFDVLQFLRVAEQWGDDYRLELTRNEGKQSLSIALHCLDPTRLLMERQEKAHAVTAFSGTLSPLPWSRSLLGLKESAVCSRATSPFEKTQLRVALATHVDTRFRAREASMPDLATLIRTWLDQESGNCIVYFPSYRYMEDCMAQMNLNGQPLSGRQTWQQRRESNDMAQQGLLDLLAQSTDVAAFCILGGIFGEAIDLPGDQLSSVVIVGVGMPQVNRDTKEQQAWYDKTRGAGFEYAFLYPGMQKVDQAMGRVVRTMEDKGSALLIDPRYREAQYRELLPQWWDYQRWPGN
jgi:DNA excision repair protein ERCC-2